MQFTILAGAFALALLAAAPADATDRSLSKEVTVPANVDAVWEAWTTTAGIKSFFAPDARIEARVGGPFEVYMDPKAEPGMRGADDMRVMAVQPKKMISFDWNAPPSLPQARQHRTFVVVRLYPVDPNNTRVTLNHSGWGEGGEWDLAYSYFDRAWTGVLGNLKTRFEKGPYDWAPWLAQLEAMRLQQAGRPPTVTK